MHELIIDIEFDSGLSIQHQIREKIIHLIQNNQMGAGSLPSSRRLARSLGVSRNTVTLAYESLMDDGYLISKERRGFFVNPEALVPTTDISNDENNPEDANRASPDWSLRLQSRPADLCRVKKDPNWFNYPFPFVYGQVDREHFPLDQWRACNRWVQTKGLERNWVDDYIDEDDDELVRNIRQQILTARGIVADTEEVLITLGTQNSMYLVAQLLVGVSTTVGIENPGYIDFRNILVQAKANLLPLDVDGNGIVQNEKLSLCDYVITTPSHQYPTTVTMPMSARKSLLERALKDEFVVIEDDYESEINFLSKPLPALKSMDNHGRVIYFGSLSKSISPGLRIGYMVADKALIQQLKALRRLNYRHPPANNQRASALFISQGYYGTHVRRMKAVYSEKWHQLSACLKRHLNHCTVIETEGSFCFWIRLPAGMHGAALARLAAERGVLIEEGDDFFLGAPPDGVSYIRLGYSAINVTKIEQGILLLKEAIDELSDN